MTCPRCGQGSVIRAKINSTGKYIYLCNECDAMWFSRLDIGNSPFLDFGTYMEEMDLPPLWSELSIDD